MRNNFEQPENPDRDFNSDSAVIPPSAEKKKTFFETVRRGIHARLHAMALAGVLTLGMGAEAYADQVKFAKTEDQTAHLEKEFTAVEAQIDRLVYSQVKEHGLQWQAEKKAELAKLVLIEDQPSPVHLRQLTEAYSKLSASHASHEVSFHTFRFRPGSEVNSIATTIGNDIYVSSAYLEAGIATPGGASNLTGVVAHEVGHNPYDFKKLQVIDQLKAPEQVKGMLTLRVESTADTNAMLMLAEAGNSTDVVVDMLHSIGAGQRGNDGLTLRLHSAENVKTSLSNSAAGPSSKQQ